MGQDKPTQLGPLERASLNHCLCLSLTNQPTPWSKAHPEKPSQEVSYLEPAGSLLCLQEFASGLYPEPNESILIFHTLMSYFICLKSSLVLSYHLYLDILGDLFHSGLPVKIVSIVLIQVQC
jgi:hypothetical protein